MIDIPYGNALIIGAGLGISAALTRALRSAGLPVIIASRNPDRLAPLVNEARAVALQVDASDAGQIARLFEETAERIGPPEIVIYNASSVVRGPIAELEAVQVEHAVSVTALGAFHAMQQAARHMVPAGRGAVLLTGATAGIKGFARSAPFAMGKFALRGLAQSAARELAPQGIHVVHVIVDGSVRASGHADPSDRTLDPDAIAQCYIDLLRQHGSTWSWEIELRPWVENF